MYEINQDQRELTLYHLVSEICWQILWLNSNEFLWFEQHIDEPRYISIRSILCGFTSQQISGFSILRSVHLNRRESGFHCEIRRETYQFLLEHIRRYHIISVQLSVFDEDLRERQRFFQGRLT